MFPFLVPHAIPGRNIVISKKNYTIVNLFFALINTHVLLVKIQSIISVIAPSP